MFPRRLLLRGLLSKIAITVAFFYLLFLLSSKPSQIAGKDKLAAMNEFRGLPLEHKMQRTEQKLKYKNLDSNQNVVQLPVELAKDIVHEQPADVEQPVHPQFNVIDVPQGENVPQQEADADGADDDADAADADDDADDADADADDDAADADDDDDADDADADADADDNNVEVRENNDLFEDSNEDIVEDQSDDDDDVQNNADDEDDGDEQDADEDDDDDDEEDVDDYTDESEEGDRHEEDLAKGPGNLQVPQMEEHNAPGENGAPVHISKNSLNATERKKYDKGWKDNAYNQYGSDLIPLHRTHPDPRRESCKSIPYHPIEELPSTSVIVIFHNEGWSVLLRTVHSVIDRSPPEILKEVILVDDCSTMDHLLGPLETYFADYPQVIIARAKKREGLIRARLLGAETASGEVLVFLDSHCEAMEGWLVPLVDRIHSNWTNVVTPVIDQINDETFHVYVNPVTSISVGGFSWGLIFNWHTLPKRVKRASYTDPAPSPTMAGGLFAISKKYFQHLGMYDPGMFIWGGENLEISFKIWMCGGQLHIIPCSHVGHIFRKRSPYTWKHEGTTNDLNRNLVRLAEVWLDEYKEYYYERINNNLGDYGDVSERKALRERLHCKSFRWYLDTIYPELYVPSKSIALGEVRNSARNMCLDADVDSKDPKSAVIGYPCHGMGGHQFWMLSPEGEIRRDEKCLDYAGSQQSKLKVYSCHGQKGNQNWQYTEESLIKHSSHHLCLELAATGDKLSLQPCDVSLNRQIWFWKRITH